MKERRQGTWSKPHDALLTELRGLIEAARLHVTQAANATLTMLYWHVGQRIHKEVLKEPRAEYGEESLSTLSAKLVWDYGQGFSARNLAWMVQFAEAVPDDAVVSPLATQLSWSRFIQILPLEQPLDLRASNIRVAENLTHIPDMEVSQAQLHRAVQMTRERATQATLPPGSGHKILELPATKPQAMRKRKGDAA